MTRSAWFPVAMLVSAMISIQAGAAIAKQLLPFLGAAGTATLRLCFASLILCLVCRPWRERLNRRSLTLIAQYGLVLGSMNLFFCLALLSLPLGIAVALEFMGPLAVAVCSSRRRIDFIWITMAMAGVVVLLPKADSSTALPLQGVVFALCAATCWALYIVIGQKAGATASSGTVASIGMFAATLAVAPLGIVTTGQALLNVQYWPTALVVAVLSSAIPYSLEMIALKAMPARTFGILMSMEPAVASLSGMVILHEYLSGTQWLAVAFVMLASFGAVAFSRPLRAVPEAGG